MSEQADDTTDPLIPVGVASVPYIPGGVYNLDAVASQAAGWAFGRFTITEFSHVVVPSNQVSPMEHVALLDEQGKPVFLNL